MSFTPTIGRVSRSVYPEAAEEKVTYEVGELECFRLRECLFMMASCLENLESL